MKEGDFPELPEYIRNILRTDGEIEEIRLDGNGTWHHEDEPFTNPKIIDLFNRAVDITKDGTYVLHYKNFVYPIRVDDAPVFVTGVNIEGFGFTEKVLLSLSTGEVEELDTRSLHYKHGSGLYCYVRGGRLLAKFKRSPSFQLLERLEESEDIFYITICGKRIVLTEKIE